jgi:hypothetical protein
MELGLKFLSFNHSCDLANVENIDAVSILLFCKDGIQLEGVIKRERETERETVQPAVMRAMRRLKREGERAKTCDLPRRSQGRV